MKKLLVSFLAGVMAMGLLAGCGSATDVADAAKEAASNEEVKEVVDELAEAVTEAIEGAASDRTTFVVGFDAEFPPYGYMDDNGDYTGFDLDLAEEVCARNGWELVKQPIDWDSKDMELSSGSIDCIWSGFTIQGREDDYTWTVPYVDNSQVFVVKSSAGISSQADLAGKNVGVQKDSSALAALEGDAAALADTFASLTQYADYNTAFMDLEAGAMDAVAIDIGVANYQINQRGDEYVILSEQLATEQYGIGFLKGNDELKNQVEKTLLEMAEDGTVDKIAQKYADFGLVETVCLGK